MCTHASSAELGGDTHWGLHTVVMAQGHTTMEHTHTHMHTHTHSYTYTNIHAYTQTHVLKYKSNQVHTHVHKYTRTHVHKYTRTHIKHTHKRTYAHLKLDTLKRFTGWGLRSLHTRDLRGNEERRAWVCLVPGTQIDPERLVNTWYPYRSRMACSHLVSDTQIDPD